MKRCGYCRKWKPPEAFNRCRTCTDGIQYRCRDCFVAIRRVSRTRNRPETRRCIACGHEWPLTDRYWIARKDGSLVDTPRCRGCHRSPQAPATDRAHQHFSRYFAASEAVRSGYKRKAQ